MALPFRLIKHTKQLLEENEEKLCIKVLQTLREMMTKDRGYGEKVLRLVFTFKPGFAPKLRWRVRNPPPFGHTGGEVRFFQKLL